MNRRALLEGHDDALEAAVQWIHSQHGTGNTRSQSTKSKLFWNSKKEPPARGPKRPGLVPAFVSSAAKSLQFSASSLRPSAIGLWRPHVHRVWPWLFYRIHLAMIFAQNSLCCPKAAYLLVSGINVISRSANADASNRLTMVAALAPRGLRR